MKLSMCVWVASLFVCACGGTKATTTEDLGVSDDLAVTITDQATGMCNALSLGSAPEVEVHTSGAAAPTALGGTIADGTYSLTSSTLYASQFDAGSAGMLREVISVHGGVLDQLTDSGMQSSATFTTNGTTLSVMDTCPDKKDHLFDYTATATELTRIQTSSGVNIVAVFTKQ